MFEFVGFSIGVVVDDEDEDEDEEGLLFGVGSVVIGVVMSICLVEILEDSCSFLGSNNDSSLNLMLEPEIVQEMVI